MFLKECIVVFLRLIKTKASVLWKFRGYQISIFCLHFPRNKRFSFSIHLKWDTKNRLTLLMWTKDHQGNPMILKYFKCKIFCVIIFVWCYALVFNPLRTTCASCLISLLGGVANLSSSAIKNCFYCISRNNEVRWVQNYVLRLNWQFVT